MTINQPSHSVSHTLVQFLVAALVVVVTLLIAAPARADFKGHDYKDLVTFTKSDDLVNAEAKTIYDRASGLVTPEAQSLLPRLERIAQDQATIWSDTILEGQFDSEGATSLDGVQALYKDGQVIAYRILYSDRAWTTDLEGARVDEGRIEESTYVSPAMASWFRDDAQLATFSIR